MTEKTEYPENFLLSQHHDFMLHEPLVRNFPQNREVTAGLVLRISGKFFSIWENGSLQSYSHLCSDYNEETL